MTKTLFKACLVALALATAVPVPALAADSAATTLALTDPAAKQVRVFYDTLLYGMKHAKELGVKGRYKKLEPVVEATFDFPTMTQRTVGPDWTKMSATDHAELIDAFRRMTIADYARNFDGYSGEAFVVDPKVQERAGDKIVRSEMTAPGKAPIPFVYRLAKTKSGWKITDVFLNGYVSEVATRRADFASTLKSGGASALVAKLNALSEKILSGH